jgi:ABC-type multidrug transport system permease subunit
VPIEHLPRLLQWTSRFVPTTYATAAVRSALVSQLDADFWLNLAVLTVFCVLALIVVNRHLDWRT